MTRLLISVLIGVGMTTATPALAGTPKQAEQCVRSAMWDGWADGWYNHSMRAAELEPGAAKHFLVTMQGGMNYTLLGCGDSGVENLDMMVYDLDGHVIARDYSFAGKTNVQFTPEETGGYYVVLHARETAIGKSSSHVAVAVTYR